jgi:capsular polysaccharide transport system permease protein
VRAALEAFLNLLSAIVLLAGASLFNFEVLPADLLGVMGAILGLWLFGVGVGLILSASTKLVTELGKVINILITPLTFISGVMIPASTVPQPYRDMLLFNPILHGLECLRGAYFAAYHTVPEASLAFLYLCALTTVFFGLALHVRYSRRLVAE